MSVDITGSGVSARRKRSRVGGPAFAAADPERIRELVVEAGVDEWSRGLLESLKPGSPCAVCGQTRRERWAYRLFAEVAKLVGGQTQILIAIWQQLGVRDEPEARRLIATARGVDDLDEHGAAELSVKYLDTYRRKFPDRWPEIARSLVGPPPTDGKSGRTNGGGP